ncbi:hypothetical protein [Pseudoalteromonas mariniglutinosa]|uniref:hypothetical protein n=1 Tax=Pseudoalteromonas mariniglutinosa TaxID=206042 RepID=UPI003851324C
MNIKNILFKTYFIVHIVSILGCSSLPNSSISATRMNYNEHLRNSESSQLLHNIVALNNNDVPYFLFASSLLSQISKEGTVSTGIAIMPAIDNDLGSINGSITVKESPSITYTPLQGEDYSRLLLTPIPVPLLLALVESNWPIDSLMKLSFSSINGIRNQTSDNTLFNKLINLLEVMQKNSDISIKVQRDDKSYKASFLINPQLGSKGRKRLNELKKILGIKEITEKRFLISFNYYPSEPMELAIITRSIFDIMKILGNNLKSTSKNGEYQYINIKKGSKLPKSTYIYTKYRQLYYWIDEKDATSQKFFLLTQLLIKLKNTSEIEKLPILSIGNL